jgi:hypothetical protein
MSEPPLEACLDKHPVLPSMPDASEANAVGTADAAANVVDTNAGCVEASSQASPEAKKTPTTLREFETALRGLGYSKREAVAIARDGFAALSKGANNIDVEQLEQLRAALECNARLMMKD